MRDVQLIAIVASALVIGLLLLVGILRWMPLSGKSPSLESLQRRNRTLSLMQRRLGLLSLGAFMILGGGTLRGGNGFAVQFLAGFLAVSGLQVILWCIGIRLELIANAATVWRDEDDDR